jgi:hypothetical protein
MTQKHTWIRLIDFKEDHIRRGSLLRFPAQYPYESIVELMVFEANDSERGLGLMVSSGYKAGLTLVILPFESRPEDKSGLMTQWLVNHWQTWVYPKTNVNEVWLTENWKIPKQPK